MVWIRCHGKWKNAKPHYTQTGRTYVMVRNSGGGVKRKYVHPKK